MALTNCIECGREVSDKAISCPGCGFDLKAKRKSDELTKQNLRTIVAMLIIILIVFILYITGLGEKLIDAIVGNFKDDFFNDKQ